jgi:hypothetical protein
MFMTSYESGYFRNANELNIRQIGPSDCELGPWQFTFGTASGYKQFMPNIFKPTKAGIAQNKCPNPQSVKINLNDDRLYLESSTRAAANYVGYLIGNFPNDPVLGIMAYNMGSGNADKLTSTFDDVDDFSSIYIAKDLGYNFKKLDKFRTAGISYVSKFLAMYFIGADPKANGIDESLKGLEVTCDQLYPPSKRSEKCK